jgi:hypothetical protein
VSISYLSVVQGLATGQAGSTTVTAYSTSGAQPASTSATIGTVWESGNQAGLYGCEITLATPLALGTVLYVRWSVNGVLVDDPSPAPLNGPLDPIVGTNAHNMRQKLELILSAVAASLSGLPSGPAVFRDEGNTANLISTTFDANDNRTTVVFTPPA